MTSTGECGDDLIVSKHATFSDLLTGPSLNKFAEQMYQARLIADIEQDYGTIVESFKLKWTCCIL